MIKTLFTNWMSGESCKKEELKPCCVCPETRKARDECVLYNGPDSTICAQVIEVHIRCLESYGFYSTKEEKN